VPDGEVVILRLKPHPLFIVLSVLFPLAWCGMGAAVLWWASGRQVRVLRGPVLEFPDAGRLWAAPAALGAMLLGWQVLEWWARAYLLTDRRVVRVSGVLRQVVIEVPLPRVQQVMMYRSLRERLCGLGTPGISSAASGGLSFVFWNMVARPKEQLRVLRETVERYGGGGHHGASPENGEPKVGA
jgi:uncharacterized membrane protein YdbT with pleckstrin-like domain